MQRLIKIQPSYLNWRIKIFPVFSSLLCLPGVNITIPSNYSRHSLPSGALTRVNIGNNHATSPRQFIFPHVLLQALTPKTSPTSMIMTSASPSMVSSWFAGWMRDFSFRMWPSERREMIWCQWISVWSRKYGYLMWRFWIWRNLKPWMFCPSWRGCGSIATLNLFTRWLVELSGYVQWLSTTFHWMYRHDAFI